MQRGRLLRTDVTHNRRLHQNPSIHCFKNDARCFEDTRAEDAMMVALTPARQRHAYPEKQQQVRLKAWMPRP